MIGRIIAERLKIHAVNKRGFTLPSIWAIYLTVMASEIVIVETKFFHVVPEQSLCVEYEAVGSLVVNY